MPTVIIMTKKFAEVSRDPITTLEKAGFHVWTTSNQPDILNLCRGAEQSVRLVMIDAATPGVHISELLDSLGKINPEIRVLLMADQDKSEAVEARAFAANVRGYLKRPFRRAQLLGSVLDVAAPSLHRTA